MFVYKFIKPMSEMHRIALVSDYYYPNKGGIESHIHNLALALVSLGHYVIIITHKYPDHIGIKYNGLKVYYLNIPIVAVNTTFPNLFSNINLISIFINEDIQIVHGHQSLSNLALEAIFHAKSIGLKTILTEHSLFELGGLENIIVDRLCALILRSCDRFITVSTTAKVNFVERMGVEWEKVHVIQNAIDTKIFNTKKENVKGLLKSKGAISKGFVSEMSEVQNTKNVDAICDNRKKATAQNKRLAKEKIKNGYINQHKKYTVIIVSRLVKRKGIDLLLDIIPMLFERVKNLTVYIVGDGPYRDNLEQMLDCYSLEDVHFYGELDHSSLATLLKQSDVFVNTSLTEAFCMAILEAAACGCNIVSTNVGGIHEVLPESILSLTNNDAEEIVEAIIDALDKKTCDISYIVDNVYLWEIVAKKTVKVYSKMQYESVCLKDRINKYHWFWEVLCRMYIVFEHLFVKIYIRMYH